MSNPYSTVKSLGGFDQSSQGTGNEFSWTYLLLSALEAAETANPTASTYNNPYKEVLRRLAPWSTCHAGQRLATILSERALRYDGGGQ